jgi:hypothetical protein
LAKKRQLVKNNATADEIFAAKMSARLRFGSRCPICKTGRFQAITAQTRINELVSLEA